MQVDVNALINRRLFGRMHCLTLHPPTPTYTSCSITFALFLFKGNNESSSRISCVEWCRVIRLLHRAYHFYFQQIIANWCRVKRITESIPINL